MKRFLASLVLVAALTGCISPEQKMVVCKNAEAVYAAYQAAVAAGKPQSANEIASAKIAAAVLASYCGTGFAARQGVPPGPRTHPLDGNGVLILEK